MITGVSPPGLSRTLSPLLRLCSGLAGAVWGSGGQVLLELLSAGSQGVNPETPFLPFLVLQLLCGVHAVGPLLTERLASVPMLSPCSSPPTTPLRPLSAPSFNACARPVPLGPALPAARLLSSLIAIDTLMPPSLKPPPRASLHRPSGPLPSHDPGHFSLSVSPVGLISLLLLPPAFPGPGSSTLHPRMPRPEAWAPSSPLSSPLTWIVFTRFCQFCLPTIPQIWTFLPSSWTPLHCSPLCSPLTGLSLPPSNPSMSVTGCV